MGRQKIDDRILCGRVGERTIERGKRVTDRQTDRNTEKEREREKERADRNRDTERGLSLIHI